MGKTDLMLTREAALTAMCLWEEVVERRDGPWAACREAHGVAALRHEVLDLAAECDARWEAQDEDWRDGVSFDWEWCPKFLRQHVVWDETGATLRPLPRRFASYEVRRVAVTTNGDVEQIDEDEALPAHVVSRVYWSIYGTYGGDDPADMECIGDFKSREAALSVLGSITGELQS